MRPGVTGKDLRLAEKIEDAYKQILGGSTG